MSGLSTTELRAAHQRIESEAKGLRDLAFKHRHHLGAPDLMDAVRALDAARAALALAVGRIEIARPQRSCACPWTNVHSCAGCSSRGGAR